MNRSSMLNTNGDDIIRASGSNMFILKFFLSHSLCFRLFHQFLCHPPCILLWIPNEIPRQTRKHTTTNSSNPVQ